MTTLAHRFYSSHAARRFVFGLSALAFGLGTLTAHSTEARADEVSPTGKGITGGALMGGELVMVVGGIIGVKSPWYYVIGAPLGAVGGGIGGYFVEQASTDGRIPVYMLGGGLLGIIPALVLTLNATRYQPPASAKEDKAPTNTPAADPGKAGGSSVVSGSVGGSTNTPSTPPPAVSPAVSPAPNPGAPGGALPAPPPQSLLDVHEGAFRMGVPVPNFRTLYSMQERKELGLGSGYEMRVSVVRVTF